MFYYKCENCQSEWNGIKQLDSCPFCDTRITVQNSNFTKIDKALSYIFSAYGIDVVKEDNRLVALLSDYAPMLERERKLIRVALRLGIYSDLITVNKDDKSLQDLAVNKAVSKLHNDAFMDPIIAKETIGWFISQLHWEEENTLQVSQANSISKSAEFAAKAQFQTIDTYSIFDTYSISKSYKAGDIVEFGNYPFEANGRMKPITWRIIYFKGNKALLWSEYCVDANLFAAKSLNNSWECSTLRQWLRDKFMYNAFTREEISYIDFTEVETSYEPVSSRNSGSKTTDKIFIPSLEEINKYRLLKGDLIVKATPYAQERGVFNDNGYAFWWLRTPGSSKDTEMLVSKTGEINKSGSYVYLRNRGIRPALWVDLNKLN